MSDLYQQLDKKKSRKVSPRTNDGFVDSNSTQQRSGISAGDPRISSAQKAPIVERVSDNNISPEETTREESNAQNIPDYIVETSKSKLLTLEVGIRQELDKLLYENPDTSWDTILEAALVTCLSNQNTKKKIIKVAQERLTARKKTAVYKRTKTMARKYV